MRKLLTKTMVLALLMAVVLSVSAAAAEIGTGVVNASSLRLRSEPSLSSSTIAYLSNGTTILVYEQLDGWYKVVYNELTGYVSADYLVFTPSAQTGEPTIEADENPSTDNDSPNDSATAEGSTTAEGVISGSNVNFRSQPSTQSEVLGKLSKGTVVEVVANRDGWCEVVYNGTTGYVSSDYVAIGGVVTVQPKAIVIGSCVNVRSGASTGHGIVTKVYAGAVVDLLETTGDWCYISYNGYKGYICADYIREYKGGTTSAIGEQVVALAMSYLGVPYVYGGASPNGFDCSGFTMYIFKKFGYDLPHSASSQWYNTGEYVERRDLQPGDIVLFADPSRTNGKACSHVGIYIGNGEFIHASSGSSGKYVRISSLTSGYYNTYYKGAKRLG